MSSFNRRNFLKTSGLATIPGLLTSLPLTAKEKITGRHPPAEQSVKFFGDGEIFDGIDYVEQLQLAHNKQLLKPDRYGSGGAVEELEKRMAVLTGKEKAIFIPTGTLANQLAIAVLSGHNTKVFVQDTSHVYRDEADAAQSIFNKRLMPLAPNETYFTADALQQAIADLEHQEVFKSGLGCVSIENPVRRRDGRMVPLDEIRKISEYCRNNKLPLHLDGARLMLAAAWSGTSVREFATYFDTVYLSLYKFLGASAGAVLCGNAAIIDRMPHLVKVHGGSQFGNWLNAAMAIHRLEGFEERIREAIARSKLIFSSLNQVAGLKIEHAEGGTNIYSLKLPAGIQAQKFTEHLATKYTVRVPRPGPEGVGRLMVNETLLYRDAKYVIDAFKDALERAKA